jgi:hypothetical protein
MMLDEDTIRGITRSAVNYRRGCFCPAELWSQVLGRLTVEDAETILGRLPPEARSVLRDAYHERPWSLRDAPGHGEVPLVVEEWCQRFDF